MDQYIIQTKFRTGQYDDVLDIFQNEDTTDKLEYYSIVIRIHAIRDNYEQLMASIDELKAFLKDNNIECPFKLIQAELLSTMAYIKRNKLDRSKEILEKIDIQSYQKLMSEKEYNTILEFYYRIKGEMCIVILDYENAIKHFKYALEISQGGIIEDAKYKQCLSFIKIAYSFIRPGDFNQAIGYLEECEATAEEIDDLYINAILQNGFGLLYLNTWKYTQAFRNFNLSLKYWKQIENEFEVSRLMINIGSLYRLMGNYSKSEEILLPALEYQRENKLVLLRVVALYQLIRLYLDQKNKDPLPLLKEIESLLNPEYPSLENELYIISKAYILANSPHVPDKLKAMKILAKISKRQSYMLLIIEGIKLEIYLLLDQYKVYHNKKIEEIILSKIKFIEDFYIGKTEDHFENYLFRSRLHLLKNEFREALDCLAKIEKQSIINNQPLLRVQVEVEKLLVQEKLLKIRDIYRQNYEFMENIPNLDSYIINSYNGGKKEIPIALLILDAGGVLKFSLEFDKGLYLDPNLIGALISAITLFAEQTFGVRSILDKINYHDFDVTIKTDAYYKICYISKEKSVGTEQKVSQIYDYFVKSEYYSKLTNPLFNIDKSNIPDDIKEKFFEIIFS